jgi:hypothetical protein
MRYDRAALAQAAQQALDAHRRTWERDQEEAAVKVAQHQAEWVEEHAEEWRRAIRRIQGRLRKGLPVRREDIATDRYRQVLEYHPLHSQDHPKPADSYRPPQDVAMLAKLLDTVADDYITSAGLGALGITSGTMRFCLRFMAKGSAHN